MMTQRPILLAAALSALALLSACGDDLESRQAAAEERMGDHAAPAPQVAQAPERRQAPTDMADEAAPDGEAAEGTGDEAGEQVIVDAAPAELIDNAQGFAPTPMDDARGFDPSPLPPETYED